MASLTQPHWECISPVLRNVFLEVGKQTFARRFYLAGGTALGLQLGHRLSMDLDFFSTNDELEETSRQEIISALQQKFVLDIDEGGLASLHLKVEGELIGFMGYSYPLLAPTQELEGVQLASLLDIGLMKLDAVAGRGMRAGLEIQTTPSIRWNDARNFFKREARRIGQQWFSQ